MRESIVRALEAGYRAQQAGNLATAEKRYRGVLKRDPGNVHALNLLGMLCVNAHRPKEAVRYISRALEIDDNDPDAHANLALACKDTGKPREAVRHFRASIRLNPENPVVHNNLGNVLRLLDQPGEAARCYERALKLQPTFAECWSNLAAAMNESDRHEKAFRAVDRALQLDPGLAQAWNNKGDILLAQARYGEALEHYKKATGLSPRYAAAMINMARVQRDMEAPEEALATLGKVLDIEPNNPEAHHVLGVLHEQMGDRTSAATHFQAAIDTAPEMGIAHYQLAQINGRAGTDTELAAMRAAWEMPDLSRNNRMYLAFGLARALEQRGEYDEAYAHVARGNAVKAETRPYDDVETAEYVNALHDRAAAAVTRIGRESGCPDERPVFVVGMPRSGTSLTEQILASHSAIAGAGELSFAYDTAHRVRDITGQKFPDNMDLLSPAQFRELGEYYLSRHAPHNLAARYVVDKTPLNFQYIGLLGIALPRARFIYCHRDPMANCWAIHRIPFDEKQTYAHSLTALGQYYRRHRDLLERWKSLFPGRILDVRYEDTVADVERQSRRMLNFLDLEFEPEVLAFHQTRRLVKTPSASQVREPIYDDAVAAWKRFEGHLGPLKEALRSGA
ncbi:MAG: tetratricopeptide repeat protein [Gammaproteobacteria bacterium]|nr:tetratricopeptide repeat protein [Gammaproteobacteria bacterium]MDE0364394.1 tetratricopeptide repeat protein [Gammaproteobacteria bacterium]